MFNFTQDIQFELVNITKIFTDVAIHPLTKTLCLALSQTHYVTLGQIMKALTTVQIKELMQLAGNNSKEYTAIILLISLAEGQTDVDGIVDNKEIYTNFAAMLLMQNYFNALKITPNYKAYSLFDLDKKLFQYFTLREMIKIVNASNHETFISFLKREGDKGGTGEVNAK